MGAHSVRSTAPCATGIAGDCGETGPGSSWALWVFEVSLPPHPGFTEKDTEEQKEAHGGAGKRTWVLRPLGCVWPQSPAA